MPVWNGGHQRLNDVTLLAARRAAHIVMIGFVLVPLCRRIMSISSRKQSAAADSAVTRVYGDARC